MPVVASQNFCLAELLVLISFNVNPLKVDFVIGKEFLGSHTVSAPIGAIHRDRHNRQFRDHSSSDASARFTDVRTLNLLTYYARLKGAQMLSSSSSDGIEDILRRKAIGRAVRESLENWSWLIWIYLTVAVANSGFALQRFWRKRQKAVES